MLRAAISDTDILIHLYETDLLDVIENLFEEIYVPRKIMQELQKKNKEVATLVRKRHNAGEKFINTEDKKFEKQNAQAMKKAREYNDHIDDGEAHCIAYSYVLGIPIVISNNSREFKFIEEYVIPLNFPRILYIAEIKGILTSTEANTRFTTINQNMSRPSSKKYSDWKDEMDVLLEKDDWKLALL